MELPAGQMHFVDEGAGEAILFVHGTPTWSHEWRHVIGGLSPGYRCIAPDHLGFGLSERPRAFAYTPEAHAAVLASFVAKLGLRDFTLVVHDFGGPIGLPLALAQRGAVKRLVVLNSWMWSLAEDARMVRGAKFIGSGLGRWLYRHANASLRLIMPGAYGDKRKLTREVHRAYLDRFGDAWSREAVLWTLARSLLGSDAFYRSLWDGREQLQRIPSLIVWGMKDPAFQPSQLARWREALPHARVIELPASGHWPHEEEPGRVTEELSAFLGST
jgi:haloalkane dehalogenase